MCGKYLLPCIADHVSEGVSRSIDWFLTGYHLTSKPYRGRMTNLISMESVEEYLKVIPHSDFVDVQEAGHMVAGDSNYVFK